MTKKEAKRLSLLKWQMIIDNNGRNNINYPDELMELKAYCGYCEKYNTYTQYVSEAEHKYCQKCPIYFDNKHCMSKGHPYLYWGLYRTKKTAQKVYNLIKKS